RTRSLAFGGGPLSRVTLASSGCLVSSAAVNEVRKSKVTEMYWRTLKSSTALSCPQQRKTPVQESPMVTGPLLVLLARDASKGAAVRVWGKKVLTPTPT